MIELLLGGVIAPIALGGILPDGASLVSPVPLKMIPAFGPNGSTLLIGLDVDIDAGVNRNRFRDDFATDLLAGGTADWRLEIDSELVRQRAAATLANLDLNEEAPDGRGIQNWVATTSTGVLWSGDPITIQTHAQSGYILEHYDEHPLWFVVEGFFDTGLTIALASRAVGHADLIVNADAGAVMTGIPVDNGVIVRGQRGQPVGLTSTVGGLHQLTVPLDQPEQLQFEHVGGRDLRLDKVMLALGQLEPVLSYVSGFAATSSDYGAK